MSRTRVDEVTRDTDRGKSKGTLICLVLKQSCSVCQERTEAGGCTAGGRSVSWENAAARANVVSSRE